ncbi:RagB/SusD family nutrient uptake outer membrane protein [Mongoliitalea daihaiensis]|uniref:RagB/SusD family nutrient uptake outer membrane protein n=1 Tax=Mongoliitalea daihaiensis TaxID=2782006 RepID=UPI001F238CFC|nr:RagB/SusD family nutrient uptake outer membrane protein [Mongoliitalea daihaiensis]UJP65206.1 RagB/SusD family nutrient uptake outer membrane protein [Mongoliitalea daihaiensis]
MTRMNYISKIVLSFFVASALFLTSCEDALLVDPRQSIDADGALGTPDAVDAALNSVYARLRATANYGRNMFAVSDALADVGQTTNNSGRLIGEFNNNPGAHHGNWANSYFAINEANLILDGIAGGVTGATTAQLSRWEGEAKFLRALYYFDLIKIYAYMPTAIYQPGVVDEGGVPLVLEGVITSQAAFARQSPRATIAQVYDQIYADLEDAKRLLTSRGPQFASSGAASALLSRVALYRGDWAKSRDESTLALNSGVGTVLGGDAYVAGWRTDIHPESMFEVRFAIAAESIGVNESLQSSFTTILNLGASKNAQGGWGDFIPNPTVRGFFGLTQLQVDNVAGANNDNWDVTRNDDVRAFLYTTGNSIRGAGRQIECIKFASKNGFAYGDNVPVIRKSEMHLNRAEANYQLGNVADALAELNAFKGLRGVATVDLAGEALLNEILLERFKEFAFEGQRFFDLKRYGRGPKANIAFDDFRILPPIPQREVDGNTNLNQNRGY